MEELLENIGTILTSIIDWFTQIGSYLITNPIFLIMLGIGIGGVLYILVINIILSIQSYNSRKDWENWKKYSDNDNQMREEEDNYIEDFGRW